MPEERTVFIEGADSLEEDEEFQKLINQAALEESALQFPRGYISISQLNMFLRCGLQYKFRYVDALVSPPGVSLIEGSSMHRALEVGLREKKDTGKAAPVSVMTDAWRDEWIEQKKDVEEWGDDGEYKTAQLLENRGLAWLQDYHANKMPNINPIDVEQRFWTTIGKNNIPVLGYIDLIDQDKIDLVDGQTVVDHKVVRSSKSQADADNDPQLTLYSMATQARRVRFDCFVKTKTPKIKSVSSTRTPHDYHWLARIFDKVAETISAGVFLPCDPTSWVCTRKFCGYYRMCRGKGKNK